VGNGASRALVNDIPARAGRTVNRVPGTLEGHPLAEPTEWANEFERRGWAGQRAYQLLVELTEIEPRIWRRVVVADATPLPLLHRILQVSFSWNGYHLHEFKVGSVRFGVPDDEYPPPHIDETHVRLYQLAHKPGDRIVYVCDFGDSWEHDVVLEEMRAAETLVTPICLDGERAAPPEDCGGVSGYEQLVGALRDPSHPEHMELREWAGKYDPEGLNLELINRRLAKLPRGRARD
jgi:Plasmid pRiA4b ORF-3-like protein